MGPVRSGRAPARGFPFPEPARRPGPALTAPSLAVLPGLLLLGGDGLADLVHVELAGLPDDVGQRGLRQGTRLGEHGTFGRPATQGAVEAAVLDLLNGGRGRADGGTG